MHIDDEGGLVHMATALGTKCAVLFGPTPVGIFGYEQNINICADTCKECFGIVPYCDKLSLI
jgi:ADP-heptose:LPS heptosyltransferase